SLLSDHPSRNTLRSSSRSTMFEKRATARRRTVSPVDDAADHDSSNAASERTALPLLPLDTTLLPGAHMPLHIIEPRHRQLTADLMNAADQQHEFGIVTSKTPLDVEITSDEQVHRIGCSAQLREVESLPDGRFAIVTTGRKPFRLVDVDPTVAPYLMGTIEWIDDEPVRKSARSIAAVVAELARNAHRRYCDSAWDTEWSPPPADTDFGSLAYALVTDCLLP